MFEIRSYKTSIEAFILADRFENNIEVSNTICILKFVKISGTKPSIQGWKDLTQDLVVFMKFFHDPEYGLRNL